MNQRHNEQILAAEWTELVNDLNSVDGAPNLPKHTWQNRLQDWRYQLNQKSRKIVVEANMTGGGPSRAKELKDYEKRAVQLFNPITSTGNPELLNEAGISDLFFIPGEYEIQNTETNFEGTVIYTEPQQAQEQNIGTTDQPVGSNLENSETMTSTGTPGSTADSNSAGTSNRTVPMRGTRSEGVKRRRLQTEQATSRAKRIRTSASSLGDGKFELILSKFEEIEKCRMENDKAERERDRQAMATNAIVVSSAMSKLAEAIAGRFTTSDD